MRKVATRTTLRNQAGVIEYRPLNFSRICRLSASF
nr:MAG TPA_asm: hypothetical protein [Caudoviricetes sp.]